MRPRNLLRPRIPFGAAGTSSLRRPTPSDVAGASLLLAAFAALAAGCFNPKLEPGFACGDESSNYACPDGFFCDAVTLTCLRNGTNPSRGSLELDSLMPGYAAARLGDGVAVAGWFSDGAGAITFRVRRFDSQGNPLGEPARAPVFDDVSPGELLAAGSEGVAIFVRPRVGVKAPRFAWVREDSVTADVLSPDLDALTVTAGKDFACVVGTFTSVPSGVTLLSWCADAAGTLDEVTRNLGMGRKVLDVAASAGGAYDQMVVITEEEATVVGPGDTRELFATCISPGFEAPPTRIATGTPGTSSSGLAPQVFYAPAENRAFVGWIAKSTLRGVEVSTATCEKQLGSERDLLRSEIAGFGVAGRASHTGWAGTADVYSIATPKANDTNVFITNWRDGRETTTPIVHENLLRPRAIRDGANQLWFFVHASDKDISKGYFKYLDLAGLGNEFDYLVLSLGGGEEVTPDYAVAPRADGGFFLVYRKRTSSSDLDTPLPSFFVIFDENGDVVPLP